MKVYQELSQEWKTILNKIKILKIQKKMLKREGRDAINVWRNKKNRRTILDDIEFAQSQIEKLQVDLKAEMAEFS